MNPTHDEENLIRWLDGEMDEAERVRYEAHLAANPTLQAEALEMQKMAEVVRAHLPQRVDIPHADFFNSQVQREIEEMQRQSGRTAQPVAPVLNWFRLPWLVAAASMAVAVVALVRPSLMQHEGTTEVVSSYAPNTEVAVTVLKSAEAKATVLMLDGLPTVPADKRIAGMNVHHSETDVMMTMTTLYSESGKVLVVMGK